jgi:hypothetical protein
MYEDTPATLPDRLTINLSEAVACFEHAGLLLEQGISLLDAEVHSWLIGASDALINTGLDVAPGTLRYALLTGIAAIERRDERPFELVTADTVAIMRQEVAAMLKTHMEFFDRAEQSVTR